VCDFLIPKEKGFSESLLNKRNIDWTQYLTSIFLVRKGTPVVPLRLFTSIGIKPRGVDRSKGTMKILEPSVS